MSQRKKFLLLHKVPCGVRPQNLLGHSAQRIGIPTEHSINAGKMYVVKPLDLDAKERQLEIKLCFFLNVNINENALEAPPKLAIDVRLVDYNGTQISADSPEVLQLCVADDEQHLYFRRGNALVDKMVLPRRSILAAYFDDDYLGAVFVLLKNFGYFCVDFAVRGTHMYTFLQSNTDRWVAGAFDVVAMGRLHAIHEYELRKRENSQRDPLTVIRRLSDSDATDPKFTPKENSAYEIPGISGSDDMLRSGLPSTLKPLKRKKIDRQTRSALRQAAGTDSSYLADQAMTISRGEGDNNSTFYDDNGDDVVTHETRETPAAFEPPLHYSVNPEKKFIISFNDFKTLYNNDWINDTLIDFFIAYEMEHAVSQLRLMHANDVFAFNSFFFTKLFTQVDPAEPPPYYENIRRWLAKVDLMSYNSVIIPINEHLHWYCAIIKNLPALLADARDKQGLKQDVNQEPNRAILGDKDASKHIVDIFVVDSLKQTHANLSPPLKEVIKRYCREKHAVDIATDLIRLRTVGVSKQRNFNDCGIHVIYNIRKWLEHPALCEHIWRTHGKPNFFKGVEKSGMRKACIALLLDLHASQPADATPLGENRDSEDEVELISYLNLLPHNGDEPRGKSPDRGDTPVVNQHPNITSTSTPQKEFRISPIVEAKSEAIVEAKSEVKEHQQLEKPPVYTFEGADKPLDKDTARAKDDTILGETPRKLRSSDGIVVTEMSQSGQMLFRPSTKTLEGVVHMFSQSEVPKKHSPSNVSDPHIFPAETRVEVSKQPRLFGLHTTHTTHTYHKTLDPRLMENHVSSPQRVVKKTENFDPSVAHPQIRRLLLNSKLKKHTINYLNVVFDDHSRRYSESVIARLVDSVDKYNGMENLKHSQHCKRIEQKIRDVLKDVNDPMDVPFVIKDSSGTESPLLDASDSNGELNKSVGELTISFTKPRKSSPAYNIDATPEATRKFLKQTEAAVTSPITRHTCNRVVGRSNDDMCSADLEIVSEVGHGSEITLVFSSPRAENHSVNVVDQTEQQRRPKSSELLGNFGKHQDFLKLENHGKYEKFQKFEKFGKPGITEVVDVEEIPKENAKFQAKTYRSPRDTRTSPFHFLKHPKSSRDYESRNRSGNDSDPDEITEVVHVPENDEQRHMQSPTRKSLVTLSHDLKRRKVDDVLARTQALSRSLHRR